MELEERARAINATSTVLVACEESAFADRLRSQLEVEGCKVTMVDSGAAAVAEAESHPDLIFLDLELHDVDGLMVLRQLRGETGSKTTPVVLLQGDDEPAHVIQRGLDLGASGYIVKHRFRGSLGTRTLLAMFSRPPVLEHDRRLVQRSPLARRDACPYSAGGDFSNCVAFVAIDVKVSDDPVSVRTSCSHLRIGKTDSWRLYPRCALGDAVTREKYVRDLSS